MSRKNALRLQGNPNPRIARKYRNGFEPTVHEELLEEPFSWRKPRMVFVNSMSDSFHHAVPVEFIRRMFDTMARTPQHTFQVLTKRAERMAEIGADLEWPENVWAGVTVESGDYLERLEWLRRVPARVRFLSLEPLLSGMPAMDLSGIHWVILGGESGSRARLMDIEWARDIRDQCVSAGVPFFFKQVGGRDRGKGGRLLDGREWNEFPTVSENE